MCLSVAVSVCVCVRVCFGFGFRVLVRFGLPLIAMFLCLGFCVLDFVLPFSCVLDVVFVIF